MTTTINADTVVGGAVVTADASGQLGLQAAGNTGLTLNSSRAIGVGASPSFGTSGQVLTSAGSAAAPTWATPASTPVLLNLTLISSATVSSATSVFSFTGLSNTYKYYLVYFSELTNSNANVTLYYSSNNGSTYTFDSGAYQRYRWYADTGLNGNADSSAGRILTSAVNYTAQVIVSGIGNAANVNATSSWYNNPGSSGLIYEGGSNAVATNGATVINAMQFTFSSNVTAGKVFLYGGQP
jgi:hypothetical protein